MKNKILIGGAIALLSTGVNAATYCAHPTGAAGCEPTIQDAVTLATAAGDVIKVKAGSYNENVVIDKQLTLIGPSTGVAVIDAGIRLTGPAITVNADDVTISRLTIRNGAAEGILIGDGKTGLRVEKMNFQAIQQGKGILSDGTGNDGMVITKNKFYNVGNGIRVEGDNIEVSYNKIQIEPRGEDSVNIKGDNSTVINNKLTQAGSMRVFSSTPASNSTVSGNKLILSADMVVKSGIADVSKNKLINSGDLTVDGDDAVAGRITVFKNKLKASGYIEAWGSIEPVVTYNHAEDGRGAYLYVECLQATCAGLVKKNRLKNGNGIVLDGGTVGLSVLNNVVINTIDFGIKSDDVATDKIVGNKIRNTPTCIQIRDTDTAIDVSLNKMTLCGRAGIFLDDKSGPVSNVVVKDNKINKAAVGIGLFSQNFAQGALDNIIQGNSIKNIATFGIIATIGSDANVIKGNSFSRIARNDICSARDNGTNSTDDSWATSIAYGNTLIGSSTDIFSLDPNEECPIN